MIRFCLLALLLTAASMARAETWQYQLRFDAADETLQMRVCPPDPGQMVALRAYRGDAQRYLIADETDWRLSGRELRAREPGCARYAVAMGRLADRRERGHGYRIGDDLLSWPDQWLWWPRQRSAQIELHTELPPGWQLSTPWPQPDPDQPVYRLGSWPRGWPALVGIGRFQIERLQHGEGRIDVAVMGPLDATQRRKLIRWVDYTTGLLDYSGGFPLPQAQVLVVPINSGSGPVPWGQVYRAGFGAAHFFVNADLSYQTFVDDWTGAHEISHLLHPYLGNAGRWMGEGLATYYQNVLRIRSGDLSEFQGWQKLIQGFERGRKDRAQNQSLTDVSNSMHRNRAYMRVYWSGAAYWLRTDVELRRRSGGSNSLDQVLKAFGECCLPGQRTWTPIEFARELDRLANQDIFVPALREAESAMNFPDLRPLWQDLGLRTNRANQLQGFTDSAPLASIRQAINQPPTPPQE